jgi:hypothetical protein
MSFPAKENLIFFEGLGNDQVKLWNDSCDVGIDLTKYPAKKIKARENLLTLMSTYAYKLEQADDRRHSVTTIFIPYEFDEGAYIGVTLRVAFNTVCDREYLHIFTQNDRKTHAEIEGKLYKMPPQRREAPKVWEPTYKEALETVQKIVNPKKYKFNAAEFGSSDENKMAWADAANDAKRFN